jgi:hypothetical protein
MNRYAEDSAAFERAAAAREFGPIEIIPREFDVPASDIIEFLAPQETPKENEPLEDNPLLN